MPKENKKFVNPLLRSTESTTEPNTDTQIQVLTEASTKESTQTAMQAPTSLVTDASTETSTSTTMSTLTSTSMDDSEDTAVERRKRGKQAFDKVHMRWTLWINKKLKKKIDQLAKEEELSLVALAEEAFHDLMKKYGK